MDDSRLALLSVTDKTGIADLAKGLSALEWEILSTGGTGKVIAAAGVPIIEVSEYTGVPESPGDKVKTINHLIHGGLLQFFDKPDHLAWIEKVGARKIDLVACNLYQFEKTMREFIEKGGDITSPEAEALAWEKMDIGGPLMIRAATKSPHAIIVPDPSFYTPVLDDLRKNGSVSKELLLDLKIAAMTLTATYDAMILELLQRRKGTRFPSTAVRVFDLQRGPDTTPGIRYGENPGQEGGEYKRRSLIDLGGLPVAKVLYEGKEISYNNLGDLNAALMAAREFYRLTDDKNAAALIPGNVTVKHGNNCGFATGTTLEKAIEESFKCDPTSAFGGLLAIKGKVTKSAAQKILDIYYQEGGFVEAILAEGYDADALELLKKKKNLRVLELPSFEDPAPDELLWKEIEGGALVQTKPTKLYEKLELKTGTYDVQKNERLIRFGLASVKSLGSNAISIVYEYEPGQYKQVGAGMGNPNRVLSTQEAIAQAQAHFRHEFYREKKVSYLTEAADLEKYVNDRIGQCALISEAFIPAVDNIQVAGKAGIRVFVETGNSTADKAVLAEAEKYSMAVIFTGTRLFRHG